MAISKVVYKTSAEDTGTVWMDTTDKTVAADKMVSGITALKNDGTTVTGNLTSRSSSDLTASGATVTVPAGVYSSQASKAVSSGSATAPSTISGSSATVSTGTNTLTLSKTVSVTPSVTAGYVSSGTAGNSDVSLTASVNTRSSSDLTASTLTVTAPAGYYGSDATKTLSDQNLLAENIKKDISIFGITGSYEGGGGQTTWEQQYTGSVTVSDWGEQLNYIDLVNYFSTHSDFAYGDIYRITWKNGVQYTCVAEVEIPDGSWTGYVLGNGELWGEQFGNNEPFIAQRYDNELLFATTETAGTTFTLTIEKQVPVSGSSWTLLASEEFTVNTSSTTGTQVGTISLGTFQFSYDTIIWIHIRDKAGNRTGYFYGNDTFFLCWENSRPTNANPVHYLYSFNDSNIYNQATSTNGVYVYQIDTSNNVVIYSKYSSSASRTINGTYKCDVYVLTPATGMTMFE